MSERIFRLSESEKQSQLWRKLQEHLEFLNDRDRRRNDDMKLSEEETRTLRAMINARNEVLVLDR